MITVALLLALQGSAEVRVGSKAFTEGVVLGEVAKQVIAAQGVEVVHKKQLGGTRLLFTALETGEIDLYAEYTGTLHEELFPGVDDDDLAAALAAKGLAATAPLGFNNTYGLAMREDVAGRLGITRISDLVAHPEVVFGLSNEFLERKDGWPALAQRYGLHPNDVRGLDHDIAYKALVSSAVGVTDCYTTDAEIAHHGLRVLDDDLNHFPRYDALYLYRRDLDPRALTAIQPLQGAISATDIRGLNAKVRIEKKSERRAVAAFLEKKLAISPSAAAAESRTTRLLKRTREHVLLVFASVLLSILLALPLGVLAAKRKRAGQLLLGVVGVFQTIPSLALLVLFVPLLGIGDAPAIAAMILYALLPIVRSTYVGLKGIAPGLTDSAEVLGLTPAARLFRIELPLASPSIVSGIQTSAVISVGTATIGALIGAGGYGQSILTGVRLADTALILEGALPASLMALAAQLLFEVVERVVVPRGLRLRR